MATSRGERLRRIWWHLIFRCENPKSKDYPRYGGRGIYVCEDWKDYDRFKEWSFEHGYDAKLSIDRIDNNGPYAPWNCRWTTVKEQANNRRNNVELEFHGETKTLSQWAEEIGITAQGLWRRIFVSKWDIERALSTEVGKLHLITYKGETKRLSEWAKQYGLDYDLLERRINHLGWDIERALTDKGGRFVTYKGETKRICDWAKELGIDYSILNARINNGWDIERAFSGEYKYQSIEYNGKEDTLWGWAKTLGLNYSKLYYRMHYCGWDINKAFTSPACSYA
jgi:hypothetical protein